MKMNPISTRTKAEVNSTNICEDLLARIRVTLFPSRIRRMSRYMRNEFPLRGRKEPYQRRWPFIPYRVVNS